MQRGARLARLDRTLATLARNLDATLATLTERQARVREDEERLALQMSEPTLAHFAAMQQATMRRLIVDQAELAIDIDSTRARRLEVERRMRVVAGLATELRLAQRDRDERRRLEEIATDAAMQASRKPRRR